VPGRVSDERLVSAFRAGDETAFQQLHDRYRPALLRFATRILRDQAGAEDVVQEALWRAHRALRRDDRPISLRPWLYRLVRNCCLDELGRVRTDCVDLHAIDADAPLTAAARDEPATAFQRRADLRQLLDDLGALPARHRHALVRRELDGLSHRELAGELDITPSAARVLVHRARLALTQLVDERSTSCQDVRVDLMEAHDARRRASAKTHRHLARCAACREFRGALRATRRAMALLLPGPLVLAASGVGLKIALAGKASAGKAAAGAVTATLAVGAAGVALPTLGPGDPAPMALASRALPGGHLGRGAPLPTGTAIVRRAVQLRAGAAAHPSVVLRCPGDLRVADLLAPTGARISATYGPCTVVGASRSARIVFEGVALARDARASVAILCKRRDGGGSIVAGRASVASASAASVHVRTPTFLRTAPAGRAVVGTVRRAQPVRIVAWARDRTWARIVTDTGLHGWVAAPVVRRR
jgi:RNA polymerase sigma factor (sigma-70 family)